MLSGLVTVGRGSQQQFAFVGSSSAQHISPHLPSEQLARWVGLRCQQPHLDHLVVGAWQDIGVDKLNRSEQGSTASKAYYSNLLAGTCKCTEAALVQSCFRTQGMAKAWPQRGHSMTTA